VDTIWIHIVFVFTTVETLLLGVEFSSERKTWLVWIDWCD